MKKIIERAQCADFVCRTCHSAARQYQRRFAPLRFDTPVAHMYSSICGGNDRVVVHMYQSW
jgi:hypothetical protein